MTDLDRILIEIEAGLVTGFGVPADLPYGDYDDA